MPAISTNFDSLTYFYHEKIKPNCQKLWALLIVIAIWHNHKYMQCNLTDRTFKTKKRYVILYVASITQHNVMPASPSETKASEQNRAQFTYKWKAVVSHGIWTILPWQATEFCKLVHGIWQNFPWKTVGPTYLPSCRG